MDKPVTILAFSDEQKAQIAKSIKDGKCPYCGNTGFTFNFISEEHKNINGAYGKITCNKCDAFFRTQFILVAVMTAENYVVIREAK